MKNNLLILILLSACAVLNAANIDKINLGKQLFNDKRLSKDGTQSCASCHQQGFAFIDNRVNLTSIHPKMSAAVSQGQDNTSLGDINAPSITYAALVPEFHFDENEGLFIGGLFLDGRAKNLIEQVKQPFLNPAEMQTDAQTVVRKVQQKYAKTMKKIFTEKIFDDTNKAFEAIASSLVAFLKTPLFAPFSSKFDLFLQGKAQLTALEASGKTLFADEKKGNCAACHPVPSLQSNQQGSLFTDFSYDNLGVPKNIKVRKLNGKGEDFVDNGLFNNPAVDDPSLKGAFRVSGLRNIALTAPYMHNGVFADLKTVVHFYNTRDLPEAINPETNLPWSAAEIDASKNTEELGNLKLSDKEEDAIVAFLQTLTDNFN